MPMSPSISPMCRTGVDNMSKVSVIVPVYNVAPYLRQCMDSIVGQTLREIEIICVDDGSTDGSGAILDEYAAKDFRVKVIHQANAGAGPARNAALDAAAGEYVVFMDPDDRYPSAAVLETLYKAVCDSSCEIAGGFARCFPLDNPKVAALDKKGTRFCAFPRFGELDYSEYQVPYRYWCYIYSRDLLNGIRFPALRVFQDVVFFVNVMRKAKRFLALDFCSYEYRQHPGNASRTMNPAKIRDRLDGYCQVLDVAEAEGYDMLYARMVGSMLTFRRQNGLSLFKIARAVGICRLPRFCSVYFRTRLVRNGRLTGYMRWLNAVPKGFLVEKFRQKWSRLRFVSMSRRRRAAFLPISADKVLFACTTRNCTCNPKYIARELARRRPDLDIVWLMDEAGLRACGEKPETGRAVRMWTWSAYREFATSKVLVENAFQFVTAGIPPKRPEQRILNTWHGSLGIKRLDTTHTMRIGRGKKEAALVDCVLTNSDFEERVFAETMFGTDKMVRAGHPRNDVFFLPDPERLKIRRRVHEALGIPADVHLALFAPTFRDEAFADGKCMYDFDSWQRALEERFDGRWRVLLRLHPLDARAVREGLIVLPPEAANGTNYEDIQELLIAAEAGITDYSSWIYDYLLTGRPGFLLAPDRVKYDVDHGLYYPLETTPFPVAGTNAELCAAIRAFDEAKFARDRENFLRDKGCMEDGHASERAVDIIEKWMDEGATNGAR